MAAADNDNPSVALLGESAEPTISLKDALTRIRKLPWFKILTVVYVLVLCLQMVGMCLYVVRADACFKHQMPTYLCDANAGFEHSAKIQQLWLVTRCLPLTIAIVLIPKIAIFPGYVVVLRRLKTLPQFWQLLFLLVMALSRHVVLYVSSKPKAALYTSILLFYALAIILRAVAVVVLNFTHLRSSMRQPTKTVFIVYKLTLTAIFIDNAVRFIISLLAFFRSIQDFGYREENSEDSPDALTIHFLLEKFGTTIFHFTIMSFFWKKLFGYEDVLSSHDHYSSHHLIED